MFPPKDSSYSQSKVSESNCAGLDGGGKKGRLCFQPAEIQNTPAPGAEMIEDVQGHLSENSTFTNYHTFDQRTEKIKKKRAMR